MPAGPSPAATAWVAEWAASQGYPLSPNLQWRQARSRAWLGLDTAVVVKVHPERTDRGALGTRVAAAASPQLHPWLVTPLTTVVGCLPDHPQPVTLWPRVPVLDPDQADPLPWASIGAHLAGLHRATVPAGLPEHDGPLRVKRALDRTAPLSSTLRALGERLLRELARLGGRHTGLVHGDWHLGQPARLPDGWHLLDLDDLGVGDPAWDLGRPAGFWAAGLLGDQDWAGSSPGTALLAGPPCHEPGTRGRGSTCRPGARCSSPPAGR